MYFNTLFGIHMNRLEKTHKKSVRNFIVVSEFRIVRLPTIIHVCEYQDHSSLECEAIF